jgi:hypothetical protein
MVSTRGKIFGLVVLLASGILFVFARAPEPGHAQGKGKEYKPAVKLEFVMEQVDEVYNKLEPGVKEKKFRIVRKQALFLAEMMNLAGYYDSTEYSKEKGWEDLSNKCRDLLLEAGKAAMDEKAAELTTILGKVEKACEACHEKFRDI